MSKLRPRKKASSLQLTGHSGPASESSSDISVASNGIDKGKGREHRNGHCRESVQADADDCAAGAISSVTSALRDPSEVVTMQHRQFTRTRPDRDLDELEDGSNEKLLGEPLLNGFGKANSPSLQTNDDRSQNATTTLSDKNHYSSPRSPILRSESAFGHRRIASMKFLGENAEPPSTGLTERDKRAIALLVALYLLQGIPVGLAFGSIPYLLRSKLSYSQIGIFTLCTYPYSLKLLWSPIVDSIFSPKLGRRKSWIVPVQLIVGAMMLWLSRNIGQYMNKEVPDVKMMTFLFFTLVFFAATQDIAVDGWALTLLSKGNLSYASTAQTIGLNCGYFLSFTVFLAFNSVEFSNKYFRSTALDYPLVSLAGYLRWSGFAFIAVTLYLAFFQPEDDVQGDDPDMDLKRVYTIMYRICRLKHVQAFALVHLVAKLGTATNDAATSLKLLEKGLSKEDLALAVLIDFPFQLLFGWLAARWSTGDKPLRPWVRAMWFRLLFAVSAMFLIAYFPSPTSRTADSVTPSTGRNIPLYYFLFVVASTVLSSFASTVQFVGISAFHTQIADPAIGGTYMTLLNTVSNLGGTWPRYFVLRGVDTLTRASCLIPTDGKVDANHGIALTAQECVSDHGKALCAELGGNCVTERDGYYATSSICVIIGAILLISFVQPVARKLQELPRPSWRVKLDRQ